MSIQQKLERLYSDLCPHPFESMGKTFLYEGLSGELFSIDNSTFRLLRDYRENKTPAPLDESNGAISAELEELYSYCKKLARPQYNENPGNINSLSIHVCHACNLVCDYCYGNSGTYDHGGFMPRETAFKAMDFFFENAVETGKLNISFFGGEPLLNLPLIKEATAYAQKLGSNRELQFHLTTNGLLLDEKVEAFILANNFHVTFSFDGAPETHDNLRKLPDGSPSSPRVLPNVRRFLARHPGKAVCRATVTHRDTDILSVAQSCLDIGFKEVYPIFVTSDREGIRLDDRDYDKALEVYHRLTEKCIEHDFSLTALEENLEAEWKPFLREFRKLLHRINSKRQTLKGCKAGLNAFTVSPTGDLYPCHRSVGIDVLRLGNILEQDCREIIRDNVFHRQTVDKLPTCRECWARYICGGMCFHEKWLLNQANEPLPEKCRYKKKLIQLLLGLTATQANNKKKQEKKRIP